MTIDRLAAAPFHLDASARGWVQSTFDRLTPDQRLAQLFNLRTAGNDPAELSRQRDFAPGGITRAFGFDPNVDLDIIAGFNAAAPVPMLVSADLEGSRMSLPFGTQVLNPLGLAAVDDVEATRAVSRIMAEEGRAIGVNWTFTPVVDINHAFRSAIVGTRGFGSDVGAIERHALAQLRVFQQHGIAATAKHWPGEGYDDRDQHLVTTVNPLGVDEWEATYGRLYRAAIAAGVMSVMSAHIAFPAFVRSLDPDAGLEAFRPASASRVLNEVLLRERLGFNGLIVSDATPMAGLGAWANRRTAVPDVLAAGCDVILFSDDPVADVAAIKQALADGTLTQARIDEAVIRVLGLKAAVGLHRPDTATRAERLSHFRTSENVATATAVTKRAPTLVKDTQGLLPLDPQRHRRVLVISPGIVMPFLSQPMPFALPDMLRARGFDVTSHEVSTPISPENFDLVLYLFGEESLLTRSHIFIDWMKLGGHLGKAMGRTWHDIPTLMISFGHPYYLYDAPRVPTYINAYSTLDSVQEAVVEALLGNVPWNRHNPVDPFCGLEDARY